MPRKKKRYTKPKAKDPNVRVTRSRDAIGSTMVIPELRDIEVVDNFDFVLSNILDFMFFSYYLDLKVSKYRISH